MELKSSTTKDLQYRQKQELQEISRYKISSIE